MALEKKLQHFGSDWTEEKLDIFSDYLNAYLTALKNMKFKKIYIDAFAGTGEIETGNRKIIMGSARRALSASNQFDLYYFIEKNKSKASELKLMVEREYPELKDRVTVYQGDANEQLKRIIDSIDWRYNRALLFLDPYATQVDWKTLEIVAATKAIDVWYLFPLSALNRMLKKDGKLDSSWATCIDRLLGTTDWRQAFYRENPQLSLFDAKPLIKTANTESLTNYIIKRLETIFPAVSKKAKIFYNDKNSPLFFFCFAVSNPSLKAQQLALKIANSILSTD